MQSQNQPVCDEINLYSLWQAIMKRKILIIGLFLLIVILSAIYNFRSPKIYRGYTIFNITVGERLTPKDVADFVGTLDDEKLVSILPKTHLSVTAVKISAPKTSNTKILVTIDSKSVNDIPQALSEVQDYLNNIDIVKLYMKRNEEVLLRQYAELSELIKSAPDLLKTYHKLFNAGKISAMTFNPVEVNRSVIAIKMELLGLEQAISRLKNGGIEMAMQPYISNRPVGPRIIRSIAFSGFLSLFLGICLALSMEYRGYMKRPKNGLTENK